MLPPRSAYLICATPRSGSTLLCELLTATGVAGVLEEPFQQLRATNRYRQPRQYFEGLDDAEVIELLAPTEPGAPESTEHFEERLHRTVEDATTPNGVFATKLMWGYALDLFSRLHDRPETAGLAPHEALAAVFGPSVYVHMSRTDKVAQAISLWTAVQTAQWRDEGDGDHAHEPQYSYAAIRHLVGQLEAQDRAWAQWFRNAGITPLTITYDELVADQAGTVARVLDAAGIDDADAAEVKPVRMRRQAGSRSSQWRERFDAERAAPVA